MKPEDITYRCNVKGYMMYYKGKPIGGAGVFEDCYKKKRYPRSNVKLFRESAERDKAELLAGRGSKMYRDYIQKIDEEEEANRVPNKIKEILEGILGVYPDGHGEFRSEIYADYRDQMDDKTAGELLRSKDPEIALEDKLYDWYWESESYYRRDIEETVKKKLEEDTELFPDGLDADAEDRVEEILRELVYFEYPVDHFLDQEFDVNIMVDTGDGNYDYVLNSVYPCWYGRYGDRIDDKAGIVWLAKQQGYTKTQLWKALKDGDMANPHGFLESMRVELANLPSHMSTLTFLTKMTFRQLALLNKAVSWADSRGDRYDPRKTPPCGYIVLGKETMCGLYDPWSGGGSVLEVELEKDVKLPIKYVRCALPDEGGYKHEYSISNVYGLCSGAWLDTVREINIPKKVREDCA